MATTKFLLHFPTFTSLFLILLSLSVSANGLSIREARIHDLQLAFKHNKLTSRQLVKFYLDEIGRLNPVLNAVIELNPDALYQADKADYERKTNDYRSYSGLHGIPVLLKDNIGTKDALNTTAGSFALLGSVVPRDAGVVTKLRKAGAIILGKASLSEWAHFRSLNAPNGWSARGGQGKVSHFGVFIYIRQLMTRNIGVYICDVVRRILMFCQRILVVQVADQQYR